MLPAPHIRAVTVNHGTSAFVELLLRTLFLTTDLSRVPLSVTVLDNQSGDPARAGLERYLAAQQIAIVQTGHDEAIAGEKHGAALAAFVAAHTDCTHYLFLDADMWFIEPHTLATMLEELAYAPANTFAVQARIRGYYAGREIEGRDGIPGASDAASLPWRTLKIGDRSYAEVVMPRCSPVCCLVANTPAFRQTVSAVGLTPAYRLNVATAHFYDTFGLMTAMMAAHGQGFIVSARSVNHFTQVSYLPEHREVKDKDCAFLLDELRAGRGIGHPRFLESDWVRQLRLGQ
jgi:hypothetical protein